MNALLIALQFLVFALTLWIVRENQRLRRQLQQERERRVLVYAAGCSRPLVDATVGTLLELAELQGNGGKVIVQL